jgi:hypothetical protein
MGVSLIFSFFSNEEANIFIILVGVSLIFLGLYIKRLEKWAVILSGLVSLTIILDTFLINKMFGSPLIFLVSSIPALIVVINWMVFKSK